MSLLEGENATAFRISGQKVARKLAFEVFFNNVLVHSMVSHASFLKIPKLILIIFVDRNQSPAKL